MPRTLFLTGSLAPRAMKRRLTAEKGEVVVLEYDTLLDRAQYRHVTAWTSVSELVKEEDFKQFRARILDALELYLEHRDEAGDLSGDENLRRAALPGASRDTAFFVLVNQAIFERVHQKHLFDRIVVTPGGGVHFAFWREMAQVHGLPIEFLKPEWQRRSLRRVMERWMLKKKARSAAGTSAVPTIQEPDAGPCVLSASRRVAKLLDQEGGQRGFRLASISAEDIGQPDPALLAAETERFKAWWQNWQVSVLAPAFVAGEQRALDFQRLFPSLGDPLSREVYPRWSALRHSAEAALRIRKPAMLLSDTQINEEDQIWCLAARQLGIPVVSYTYDNMLNARIMFRPDHVLVDGMRSGPFVIAHGFPAEKVTAVRSHRKPAHACRTAAQTKAIFAAAHPRVMLADTMTVLTETQASLRIYQMLVEAARRLPQVQFCIKFHPLRVGKSEQRSFLGMDESEVQVRQRFLKSLRPPKNLVFIAPEAVLTDCLQSAAILLNTTSVSGHEAFQMGVPVISLVKHEADSIAFPHQDDWMRQLVATDAGQLVECVQRLISDPQFRQEQIEGQLRYLTDYYWKSDLRLTDAITGLLQAR